MARKQSDYLASLLAEDAPDSGAPTPEPAEKLGSKAPPSPAPVSAAPSPDRASGKAGLSLLGRENALARVASGEVRQVTQLLLDPARVRVWDGNARMQAKLSEESCRDLIDSILAEGGQKVPAVVRHVSGDPDHDYELIAGTRRHFAISWLRANSWPDMKLLAQVAELDDEAAFRLADIENRARKDISDIERARNYADAVDRHYGGKAVRMAERLKLSKGWLSKMLKAATLPDDVLAAFANLHELPLNPAYKLAAALDDRDAMKRVRREAATIVNQNSRSVAAEAPPLPGPAVFKRLMEAAAATATGPSGGRKMQFEVPGGMHGRTVLAVKGANRQGVTLHLPMASGASDEDLVLALKTALETLRRNGVSVQ